MGGLEERLFVSLTCGQAGMSLILYTVYTVNDKYLQKFGETNEAFICNP